MFFPARATLPHLLASRGNVVDVSSVWGLGGGWNMSFCNASKGAVSNFVRSLALALGSQGVRVNAVSPSLAFTGLTKGCGTARPRWPGSPTASRSAAAPSRQGWLT